MLKHMVTLWQCRGRHLQTETLGLKRIMVNQVRDPSFEANGSKEGTEGVREGGALYQKLTDRL